MSEFLPLLSETENSDYPAMSEHPLERPTVCGGMCIRLVNPHPFMKTWICDLLTYLKKKKTFLNRNLFKVYSCTRELTRSIHKKKKGIYREILTETERDKGQSSCLWIFSNQNNNRENYRYLLSKRIMYLLSGFIQWHYVFYSVACFPLRFLCEWPKGYE